MSARLIYCKGDERKTSTYYVPTVTTVHRSLSFTLEYSNTPHAGESHDFVLCGSMRCMDKLVDGVVDVEMRLFIHILRYASSKR